MGLRIKALIFGTVTDEEVLKLHLRAGIVFEQVG